MVPVWLTVLAATSLAIAFACAIAISWDMWVRGNRQRMWIMEAVWPVTALYLGPVALWGYLRYGRLNSQRFARLNDVEPDYGEPVSVSLGVSHCGAGCTLGDVIGAFAVFALGWTLFGLALPVEYLVNFTLAFALGIAFQYFSIAPMRSLGLRDGLRAALKADTLSLIAFEVGLFGWMALMQLVFFPGHIHPDHVAYWVLMQVGMVLGFLTAWPVNLWLIRRGIKEAM